MIRLVNALFSKLFGTSDQKEDNSENTRASSDASGRAPSPALVTDTASADRQSGGDPPAVEAALPKTRADSPESPTPSSPSARTPSPPHEDNGNPPPPRRKKPRWTLRNFEVPPCEGKVRFHDFNLPLSVMHAIADLEFSYTMPVQAQVIPHCLEGRDATAEAQTGTGKSAAFLVSIITRLLRNPIQGKRRKGRPRALILAPTRELVLQIEKDGKALAKYTPVRIMAVFGGMGYKNQQDQLANRPIDIIAATPGRLMDFMGQKLVDLSGVEILVLDEADRMLDMGFLPDIRRIINATPRKDDRQTLFFSATLSDEILRLASLWTRDPVHIAVNPEHAAAESVNQKVFIVTEDEKLTLLYNLIHGENLERVIVFVNRRDATRRLTHQLKRYGLDGDILSGEVSQARRVKTLERFKAGKLRILVATDVAARGLHIEGISHVINYDLPLEPEHYVHRIGRTGRAGAEGISISFADEMSSFHIPDIEAVLGESLTCEYPGDELMTPLPKPLKIKEERPPSRKGSGSGSRSSRRRRPSRGRRPGSGVRKRTPSS